MIDKQWRLQPLLPAHLAAEAAAHDISPLIAQILSNRGLRSAADMRSFLAPEESAPGDPFLLRDVGRAVARLRQALAGEELIAVYGDYDADGLTATTLLVEVLESLGARVVPYIPHRTEEGYGLHCEALTRLREQGASLVLTVDCGTSAAAEVVHARRVGLDVVVTDHHEVQAPLPPALAVINPKAPASGYPFRELAGVGVAFKLAQALVLAAAPERLAELEVQCLDLVALGTVADVVPLLGENRLLVRRGLRALNQTRRPGLLALAAAAGLSVGALDEGHIGYGLGPRLNAAGRVDDAWVAYQLLTTRSFAEARGLAQTLEERNAQRQRLTEAGVQRARELAAAHAEGAPLLVLDDDVFAAGVAGLVATKLAEERNRPVVVLERGAEVSRGSARSIPELDISAALAGCRDLLERYGGHPLAAGLALPTANIPALRERLAAIAGRELAGKDLVPVLTVDAELPLAKVDQGVYNALCQLPPFGVGNPQPLFLARGVRVRDGRAVGRGGGHLRTVLEDGGVQLVALWFGRGDLAVGLPRELDVVYALTVSDWNGSRRLELRLKGLRAAQ